MNNPVKLALQVQMINQYCAAWNEADQKKRISLLNEVWAKDAMYIDPRANLQGIDALSDHIEKIRQSRPGARIIRTSKLDVHHQIGRFSWQLILADGTKLPEGIDIVYFSEDDQKIRKIIGFFGEIEPI